MIKLSSINLKIFLSFLILAFLLLSILFIQIIPDMEEKEKNHTINQIENIIYLTNQQILLIASTLRNNDEIRVEEFKSIVKLETKSIVKKIEQLSSLKNIQDNIFNFSSDKIICNNTILNRNKKTIYQRNVEDFSSLKEKLEIDKFLKVDKFNDYMCSPKISKYYYTKSLKKHNSQLVISCDIDNFNTKGENFELKLKKDIQKSFSLMQNFHKGKVYLMWIGKKDTYNKNEAIYNIKDNEKTNKKYCLSKVSNFRFPKTGDLTANNLIQAASSDTAIKHKVNGIKTLTWVKKIKEDQKEYLYYITSIYEKDFLQYLDSSYINILPATLIAFIIAMIIAYFLFKKIFKNINILKNTANRVKKGEKNIRSNIKGNDDIALLAKDFDNMLDSLEFNIENLDKQVEDKTKLLSKSLNEKETLLKEIHHRVKNNLTITIELIKLEKEKMKSEDARNTLTSIQERIFVMELLHRKLYESKDLNLIPIEKYIQEICDDLHSSYSYDNKIKIICNIQKINMHIDYALPLGLILTELITNSFKYAFMQEGKISVSFTEEQNNCQLIIQDNGKGLNKDFESLKNKSLGFQIISNIIKGQLSGNFNYEYKDGSKFTIKFKIKKQKTKR